ncbi:MAG: helix-turn-helix transcriptional regulator [Clostridia bacterium]|nr:helix-turn-helix transcriptional regulator [Clostridia bacterium]
MKINLANQIKTLRAEKGVTQEKLSEYLGVSYQAISKWENGITSPDISLLPDIARFFDITVDQLLQVEQIDADDYFDNCCKQAEQLFRNGKREELIPLWREAYQKLPNDIRVKEMLMSAYFDTDRVRYQSEIIELGHGILDSNNSDSYYSGQAITQIAQTYYAVGNAVKAEEWAKKAHQINHCQEFLWMQIHNDDATLVKSFAFANHWYIETLFYMAARLNQSDTIDKDYTQKVNKAVVQIIETAYPNDDMSYEALGHLCVLHRCIAQDEIGLTNEEAIVQYHLIRATECAVKSCKIKAHYLSHPLLNGWEIDDAPSDRLQMVRAFKNELADAIWDSYREKGWFEKMQEKLNSFGE